MKEKYVSTRGGEANVSASEGIIKGIAKDGGLFVPSFIHDIKIDLTALKDATYGELAFEIFKYFWTTSVKNRSKTVSTMPIIPENLRMRNPFPLKK